MHLYNYRCKQRRACGLSIPFIGIFALHPPEDVERLEKRAKPFNSLYWDFCFASSNLLRVAVFYGETFNSLYWDFCFASHGISEVKGVKG